MEQNNYGMISGDADIVQSIGPGVDIKQFAGGYVTNTGLVFDKRGNRIVPYRTGRCRNYLRAAWREDGETKQEYVHRLVATAFCEKPEGCNAVVHIDGNPENNNADNLVWATQQEVRNEAYRRDEGNESVCAICGKPRHYKKPGTICKDCRQKIFFAVERAVARAAKGREFAERELYEFAPPKAVEMLMLLSSGLNYSEVARTVGCSRQNVWDTIYRWTYEVAHDDEAE